MHDVFMTVIKWFNITLLFIYFRRIILCISFLLWGNKYYLFNIKQKKEQKKLKKFTTIKAICCWFWESNKNITHLPGT